MAKPTSARVLCLGLDSIGAGIPIVSADTGEASIQVLFSPARVSDIDQYWDPPHVAWIEVPPGAEPEIQAALDRASGWSLCAVMTTRTTQQVNLANGLASTIGRRCGLVRERVADIELALHEALSNAVLHGNLNLDSIDGLSLNALERFLDAFRCRLADPAHAFRLVEVGCRLEPAWIEIEVADEGAGYALVERPQEPLASGRGLTLITVSADEVEQMDNGRRIRMRFKR